MPFARSKPAPLPEPEPREAIEAIEQELGELDQRRAALRSALEEVPARERALISEDAPDHAFDELDVRVRHLNRALGKLDNQEQTLLARVATLHKERRRDRWAELTTEFRDTGELAIAALQGAARAIDALREVSDRAFREGFSVLGNPLLPLLPDYIQPGGAAKIIEQTLDGLSRQAEPASVIPVGSGLHSVRFTQGWGQYNSGETAGFPAGQAWALIDRNVATWVDRPPPRPAASLDEAEPPRRIRMRAIQTL